MFQKMIKSTLLVALILSVACSCSESKADAFDDKTGKSNEPETVVGRVTDAQGKPIAGALVRAENNVFDSHSEVYTDANGYYKLPKLKFGGWNIYTWHDVDLNDHTYHLRMDMPSPADFGAFQPSASGAITKDFVWRLKGKITDRQRSEKNPSGYWGGMMRFSTYSAPNHEITYMPKSTKLTITLTPEDGATLLDGSAAQVITKSFTVGNETNYYWYDVPQCSYRITGSAVVDGATRQVLFGESYKGPFAPQMSGVYFLPAGSSGGYENGLSNVLSVGEPDMPINMMLKQL